MREIGLSNHEEHVDKPRKSNSVEYAVKSLLDALAEEEANNEELALKASVVLEKSGFFPDIKLNPERLQTEQDYIRRKSCSSYNWSGGISKFEVKTMHIPFTVVRNRGKNPPVTAVVEPRKSIKGIVNTSMALLAAKKNEPRGASSSKISQSQHRARDSIKRMIEKNVGSKKSPFLDYPSSRHSEEQSGNAGSKNSLASTEGRPKQNQPGELSNASSRVLQESPQYTIMSGKLGPETLASRSIYSPSPQKDDKNRFFFGKEPETQHLQLKLLQEEAEEPEKPNSRPNSKPQTPKMINSIRTHLHEISTPNSILTNSFEQAADEGERNEKAQSKFADKQHEKCISRSHSKPKTENPHQKSSHVKSKPAKLPAIKIPEKKRSKSPKNPHTFSKSTQVSPKRAGNASTEKLISVRTPQAKQLETQRPKHQSNKNSLEIRPTSTTPHQLSIDLVSPRNMTGAFLSKDMSPYTQKSCMLTTTTKIFSRKGSLPHLAPQKTADNFNRLMTPRIVKEKSPIESEAKKLLSEINRTNLSELLKESNRNILKGSKRSTFNHVNDLVGAFHSSITNYDKLRKHQALKRGKQINNQEK